MKLKQFITVLTAVLLVGALLPSGVGVAAAQDSTNDSDPIDGFLSSSDSNETDSGIIPSSVSESIDIIYSSVRGQIARIQSQVGNVLGNDDTTNADRAVAFKQAVNGNASTYEQEINARDSVEVTTGYDVHEVIIAHDDSEPQTVYVVGELNESTDPNTLTSLQALNESEWNETNRSIDHTWVVEGEGAKNADDLVGDIADRMANDESLDQSYQAELIGQYCGAESLANAERCDIRSTIWLDQTQEELRNDAQG
ncbi:hypothetical protein G9464_20925 [Halostella sp. JP-L12]|uniref:hypothetical protein n=1 Tax=Halostella TaxID=1843185 RepID=UPI0013CEC2FB|nr:MULTISPECIES: hypothetical protein [Halostella]NHN50036.1 hypothetical protein [Halostella sp. JP-L12]